MGINISENGTPAIDGYAINEIRRMIDGKIESRVGEDKVLKQTIG